MSGTPPFYFLLWLQIVKQFRQAGLFLSTFRAAHLRLGHINQMLAAKCLHHHAAAKAQKALFDAGFQHQIWIAVGVQNIGHGAAVAITGSPRLGARISHNEAALLF